MSKFQNLHFRSIDDFWEYIPAEEVKLTKYLRSIILECMPDATEKFAYNVPFYYRHSRIFYLWPASVAWGRIKTGVLLGFCRGILLQDELNYLDKSGRQEMASETFTSISEVDADLLKAYIFEAMELDEQGYLAKKHKKKTMP